MEKLVDSKCYDDLESFKEKVIDEMARLVIIDDESSICYILSEYFTLLGFEVKTYKSGEAGLKELQNTRPPDLIIMDLLMPGMTGKELAIKLKKNPRTSHIPILLMTASIPNREVMPPEETFEHFISKPFQLEDLYSAVTQLLDKTEEVKDRYCS